MACCEDHRVPDATCAAYGFDDGHMTEDDYEYMTENYTLEFSDLHSKAGKPILVRQASNLATPQRVLKKSKICAHVVPNSPSASSSSRFQSPSSPQLIDAFDCDSDDPEPLTPGALPTCCNCGCSLDSKAIYTCADGRPRRFCFSCPSPIRPTRRSKFRFPLELVRPTSDLARPQRMLKKSKNCAHVDPNSPTASPSSSRFQWSPRPSSPQLIDALDSDSDDPEPLIPGVLPTCCNCGCSLDNKDTYTCADGRPRRFCFTCPSPIRPTRQSQFRFRFVSPDFNSSLSRRLFDENFDKSDTAMS